MLRVGPVQCRGSFVGDAIEFRRRVAYDLMILDIKMADEVS